MDIKVDAVDIKIGTTKKTYECGGDYIGGVLAVHRDAQGVKLFTRTSWDEKHASAKAVLNKAQTKMLIDELNVLYKEMS